jgi:hypothetical protein
MADRPGHSPGSFLGSAVVGAPLAVGVGVGVQRMMKEASFHGATAEARVNPLAKSAEKAKSVAPIPVFNREAHLKFMTGRIGTTDTSAFMRGEGAAFTRKAWATALERIDATVAQKLAASTQGIPDANLADEITRLIEAESSLEANKAFNRFRRIMKAGISQRNKLQTIPEFGNYRVPSIRPTFSSLPSNMSDALVRMEGLMGTKSITQFYGSKAGGTYKVQLPTSVGTMTMQLPTIQEGALYRGFTQQTKYLAPDVMLMEGATVRRMNRAEYLMHLFESSVIPQIGSTIKSQQQLRKAVALAEQEATGSLEFIPRFTGPGLNRYADIRRQAVDLRVPTEISGKFFELGVRTPTEAEYATALEQQGLFGGASPTSMSKGRAMEKNLSEWFVTPKAVDWSSRIDQVNQRWFLTQEAQNFIKQSKRAHLAGISQEQLNIFETATFRRDFGEFSSAQLNTLYVDPDIGQNRRLVNRLRIGEGEALVHPGMKRAFEAQQSVSAHLRPIEGLEGMLERHLAGTEVIQKGQMLGITTTGKPFVYDPGEMTLLGQSGHRSKPLGEYMSLHYLERARMENYGKVFGDIKAVLRFEEVDKMVGADVVATVDNLRKSPHRHNKQMLSRLWWYVQKDWEKGKIARTARMEQFRNNFHSLAAEMESRAMVGGVYKHEIMVGELMKTVTAPGMRLGTGGFGSIFGAVPSVLGAEQARAMAEEAGASEAQIQAMERGRARGFAQMMFDEPMKYGGAGRRASVEPRGLEILRSGTFGELGTTTADDLAMRLGLTHPEKVATHRALTETLMSTVGKAQAPATATLYDLTRPETLGKTGTYSYADFERWVSGLPKAGGWIRPGGGQPDIFVPSAEITSAVRQFKSPAGELISGSLSGFYHDVARSASQLASSVDAYGAGDYARDIEAFQKEIYTHWAPSGKGMGAIGRGKIIGSRYERAVSTLAGRAPRDMNEVLISESQAKGMLRELQRSGMYTAEGLKEMQSRLAAGEAVGGWIGRDPMIGQFSYQPINIRAVKDSIARGATAIAIPEEVINVGVAGEEKLRGIQISRAVGMALDKDADNAALIMAGPEQDRAIRSMLADSNNQFTQSYAQHQVRMGLLKASKGAGQDMTTTLKMIAETQKLRTMEEWVPKLSIQLTEAKRAAVRTLTGDRLTNALFAAEFIEQKAISAKHLAASDVRAGALSNMMSGIIGAMQQRNPENLYKAVRQLAADDPIAQGLIGEGVTIDRGMGKLQKLSGLQSNFIPGVNLKSTLGDITNAMTETASASRLDDFMSGRAMGGARNLPENLGKAAAAAEAGGTGLMSKVSRVVQASENIAGSLGRGMIKHWKPVGLGFAATLALSNILSTPPRKITSSAGEDVVNAHMNMKQQKAADRMQTEQVHPPGQALGNPTVPAMMHQNRIMMSPHGNMAQVQMYGRTRDNLSPSQIFDSMRRASGNRITGGVSLHDNRSFSSEFLAHRGVS